MLAKLASQICVSLLCIFLLCFGLTLHASPEASARKTLVQLIDTNDYGFLEAHLTARLIGGWKSFDEDLRRQWIGTLLMLRPKINAAGGHADTYEKGETLLRVELPENRLIVATVKHEEQQGDRYSLDSDVQATPPETSSDSQMPSHVSIEMVQEGDVWKVDSIVVTAPLPIGDVSVGRNLLRARISNNEAHAAMSMRALFVEELSYSSKSQKGSYLCEQDALMDAVRRRLGAASAGSEPANLTSGYRFQLLKCDSNEYQAAVEPISKSVTGGRAFCVDETGIVYVGNDGDGRLCAQQKNPLQ